MDITDCGRPFGLERACLEGAATIRAAGRLVAGAGADEGSCGWPEVGRATRVALDLRDVTAIDAGGGGRLVGARQRLRRQGTSLVIDAASPRVRRVLHLCRLDTLFGLTPGSAPAGAGLGNPPLRPCA
jgi:hypothetical protein